MCTDPAAYACLRVYLGYILFVDDDHTHGAIIHAETTSRAGIAINDCPIPAGDEHAAGCNVFRVRQNDATTVTAIANNRAESCLIFGDMDQSGFLCPEQDGFCLRRVDSPNSS